MYQRCFAQPRICGELVHDEYGAGASAGLHSAFARPLKDTFDVVFDCHGGLTSREEDFLTKRSGIAVDIDPTFGNLIRSVISSRHSFVRGVLSTSILQKIIDLATTGQFTIPISRTAPLSEAISLIGDLEAYITAITGFSFIASDKIPRMADLTQCHLRKTCCPVVPLESQRTQHRSKRPCKIAKQCDPHAIALRAPPGKVAQTGERHGNNGLAQRAADHGDDCDPGPHPQELVRRIRLRDRKPARPDDGKDSYRLVRIRRSRRR